MIENWGIKKEQKERVGFEYKNRRSKKKKGRFGSGFLKFQANWIEIRRKSSHVPNTIVGKWVSNGHNESCFTFSESNRINQSII